MFPNVSELLLCLAMNIIWTAQRSMNWRGGAFAIGFNCLVLLNHNHTHITNSQVNKWGDKVSGWMANIWDYSKSSLDSRSRDWEFGCYISTETGNEHSGRSVSPRTHFWRDLDFVGNFKEASKTLFVRNSSSFSWLNGESWTNRFLQVHFWCGFVALSIGCWEVLLSDNLPLNFARLR